MAQRVLSAAGQRILSQLDELIAGAIQNARTQVYASDTLQTAWGIFTAALAAFVRGAEVVGGAETGAAKKEAVIAAAEQFYSQVIAPIDLPLVPNLVEPLVDRGIGMLIRPIISGTIDGLVEVLKRHLAQPPAAATPTHAPTPTAPPSGKFAF